jgi:hypothetical protein
MFKSPELSLAGVLTWPLRFRHQSFSWLQILPTAKDCRQDLFVSGNGNLVGKSMRIGRKLRRLGRASSSNS